MVRPTHAYRASLKLPTEADYQRMLQACIEALLNKQLDVMMVTSHLMKFPRDFPKGVLDHKAHPNVIRRVKASKLLAWMHKKGHTTVTAEMLRVEGRKLTLLVKDIDALLDL